MSVLTESDKEQIHMLALEGLGPKRIAERLGRKSGTVNWYMYTAGLRAPKPAPDTPKSYMRNGRRVHRFTRAEDDFIQRRRSEGLGLTQIANLANAVYKTNRTAHTILARLTMLAAREDE